MDLFSSMGLALEDKSGRTVPSSALAGKAVALYFSAHWCPPCRHFTPVLKQFYEDALRGCTDQGADLEIVFVSGDKSEAEGRAYFHEHHGNWLMLNFAQAHSLSQKYAVKGIPSLVVVDSKGEAVVPSAREDVQSAAQGAGARAVVARWRRLGAGFDWRETSGVALGGGGQPSEGGAAAMRAARLARFGGAAPSQPSEAAAAADTAPAAASTAPAAPSSHEPRGADSGAPPSAGFGMALAALPETAVLRILAQSDLGSGYSLAAAGGFANATSAAALTALRSAVERAQEAHSETTQAIEAERAAAQLQVTAEQQTYAAALAALEPLRNSRTQDRFPQLAEVFQALEEGSEDAAAAEVADAARARRVAEAAAAMQVRIASAHQRVAEGELREAQVGVA